MLDRREQVTKYITKELRGIEIGPYFNPITSRKLGYNCISIDVFSADMLRKHAAGDPNVPKHLIPDIEEVDLLGSASNIADVVTSKYGLNSFDYIISSHNFEHLPDPIRFIQGCEKVLRAGGMLSMAIPDRRTCFDYFRPHTVTGDWIEAYFSKRQRPTLAQIFEQNSLHSRYHADGLQLVGFCLADDPTNVIPLETLENAFGSWRHLEENPDDIYRDTHCSVFTPTSLEIILRDLQFLDLIHVEIVEISEANHNEFYVHLRNGSKDTTSTIAAPSREDFYKKRHELLHRINNEATQNSILFAQRILSLENQIQALQQCLKDVFSFSNTR